MTRQAAYAARQSEKGWRRVNVRLSPEDGSLFEQLKLDRGCSGEQVIRDALHVLNRHPN